MYISVCICIYIIHPFAILSITSYNVIKTPFFLPSCRQTMYYYGLGNFFKKNTIFLSVIRKIITTFASEWWFKNTSLAWGRIEKGIRCKSGTESPAVSSCNLDFAQHKSFFPDRKREDKQNRNKSEDLPSTTLFALGNFEQIGKIVFSILYTK